MRSGNKPSRGTTCVANICGTVNPMMSPADGQQKDDQNGQTE